MNPYDANLDITTIDDMKLFQDTCNDLKDEDRFTGKKAEYHDFSKMAKKLFEDVKVMEELNIPTTWDTTNADKSIVRIPTKVGMVNMLKRKELTK